MPRVTQQYRDRRREQILAAARRCFVREGFHQTSMADIFAEANLSAGAVYGHFRSKNEIIAAIAEDVILQVAQAVEPTFAREPTPRLDEAVQAGLEAIDDIAFGPDGFAYLAPQVWAEAVRDPSLAEVIQARYRDLYALIAQLVEAEQAVGRVARDGDPAEVAKIIVSIYMGYLLQRVLVGNVAPAAYASGLAAVTRQN
ncbi:TetR/AcrR family transcriptional regulator [Phytoactinopolyspora halotolerans]|uniref:TetR/AcrR family transcriptional regulator n=1 Tax=Phytoactinopolyspora halotolerans TaxID=1981512 RepID=A0A6L9SF47_9ACTN|nr:TetR/AcrR family transcriptional regulator [Phytoactinopolyspora halotolerans]NEE03218.1 TetR/AcrR family transcriptional regulator [Phytoactinopolyspora halotolerans]